MAKLRIGELLVRAGRVSMEDLQRALQIQQNYGGRIGRALVALGKLSLPELTRTLAAQLRLPLADLSAPRIPAPLLRLIDLHSAQECGFCPERFDHHERCLWVAVCHPDYPSIANDLARLTGLPIKMSFASEEDIQRGLEILHESLGIALTPAKPTHAPVKPSSSVRDLDPSDFKNLPIRASDAERPPPSLTYIDPKKIMPDG